MRVQRLIATTAALAVMAAALPLLAQPTAATAPGTDQLVKYYRKKANVPPAQNVAVTGIKDSAIKGAKEGVLQVGTPPQVKNVPFVMSADGKFVVFAAAEDVTVDPSKAVMAKIDMKDRPFRGPKDAKVTIVEYSDFQCPFCSKGYTTLETQVLKEYGDKVKFYFKQYPLPFHPWAEPAAIAAECALQQKPDAYWAMYHKFFDNQKDVNPQNVKDKAWEYVADQGIDKAKFDTCYDTKATQALVKAQIAEGQSLGVTGTPSFVINGRLLVGAQPFEQFKAVIDDELASNK